MPCWIRLNICLLKHFSLLNDEKHSKCLFCNVGIEPRTSCTLASALALSFLPSFFRFAAPGLYLRSPWGATTQHNSLILSNLAPVDQPQALGTAHPVSSPGRPALTFTQDWDHVQSASPCWLISPDTMIPTSLCTVVSNRIPHFLRLSSIPLCICTSFSLSTHQLRGTQAISTS